MVVVMTMVVAVMVVVVVCLFVSRVKTVLLRQLTCATLEKESMLGKRNQKST